MLELLGLKLVCLGLLSCGGCNIPNRGYLHTRAIKGGRARGTCCSRALCCLPLRRAGLYGG